MSKEKSAFKITPKYRGLQTFLSEGLISYCTVQQFEGRTYYVMWLFRDMLHSTKSTDFS